MKAFKPVLIWAFVVFNAEMAVMSLVSGILFGVVIYLENEVRELKSQKKMKFHDDGGL